MAAFVALVVLLGAAYKFDWHRVALNTGLLLAVIPYAWVVWKLMGRKWLLLAGLMLALAVMMIFWTAALIRYEDSLDLLLLPLPVVLLGGIVWTPVARWILEIAGRWKYRRVGGPGMQALAMASLFLPAILVAVYMPLALGLGSAWLAVSLTLVGVLLSAVIAEPLRRFLLEWGNLMPDADMGERAGK